MQYAIASDASIKRASYRIKYLISATLFDFKNLITIFDLDNIWLQQLNNNIRHRQQHLPSGTVAIITCGIFDQYHQRIYMYVHLKYNSSMSIANIQYDHQSSVKQTFSAATNVSRCQSKLNIVTRMPCSLLLSPRWNLI